MLKVTHAFELSEQTQGINIREVLKILLDLVKNYAMKKNSMHTLDDRTTFLVFFKLSI